MRFCITTGAQSSAGAYTSATVDVLDVAVLAPQLVPTSRRINAVSAVTLTRSVKQGCVIAPDFFNCVIDHSICRLLRRCRLGIQLGEYQLSLISITRMISPSFLHLLQEAMTILQGKANHVGMQISWPKTNLVAVTLTTPTICH